MRSIYALTISISLACLVPLKANAFLDDIETEYAIKKAFINEIREAGAEKVSKETVFKYRERSVQARVMTASVNTGKMNFDSLIIRTSAKYRIDPALVKALIHAESNFDQYAVSHAGARGLTQVMPTTALDLEVRPSDLYVPQINIDTGVRYLALNLQNFGSVSKAIIAYNAGPRIAARVNSREDLRLIPDETRGYLKRVLSLYAMYKAKGFGVSS